MEGPFSAGCVTKVRAPVKTDERRRVGVSERFGVSGLQS